MHMLPEALTIYGEWGKQQKIERPFPLPVVVFIAGYLCILGFERAVTARFAPKEENVDNVLYENAEVMSQSATMMRIELRQHGL